MLHKRTAKWACLGVVLFSGVAVAPAMADGLNDVVRSPMPRSALPHNHADYSMFHYVPRGDVMVPQPERGRLFFRTKDGRPDGYAEHRGGAVFYYDASGKAVRVQRLTDEELARLLAQ